MKTPTPKFLTVYLFAFLAAASVVIVSAGCTSRTVIAVLSTDLAPYAPTTSVDINTASAAELNTLPNVGPSLAQKIIDHRERYGPFRRVEHLLLIEGISDARFREIRYLVKVE